MKQTYYLLFWNKLKLIPLLLIIFMGATPQKGWSQQDPQTSLYMFNPLFFNPAYAGSRGSMNITAVGRFQWVGMDGAPMSQFISVHAPVRAQSIGLGLTVVNDRIGSRNNTSIFADFAFAIRLNKKADRLSFGINGGVDLYQYDFNNLIIEDPTDPIYTSNYFQARPNFGLGIYYYGERHFLGLSAPRILEMSIDNDPVSQSFLARHFFLMGGYVFKLNSVIQLKPSALVKFTPNAPITFDINANLYMFERFNVGLMYRFHESVGLNLAYTHKNIFTIAYAYDFPINDLRTNQFGTHEVALLIDLWSKRRPFLSPRYF